MLRLSPGVALSGVFKSLELPGSTVDSEAHALTKRDAVRVSTRLRGRYQHLKSLFSPKTASWDVLLLLVLGLSAVVTVAVMHKICTPLLKGHQRHQSTPGACGGGCPPSPEPHPHGLRVRPTRHEQE